MWDVALFLPPRQHPASFAESFVAIRFLAAQSAWNLTGNLGQPISQRALAPVVSCNPLFYGNCG
ncbi:hypothetical protein RSSM_06523 [Rhodopirellula sallentina SM41]|uniref:Uncharacterized protein n=1 Tax=Rhodopirellula sallentina SM41 TaxID=1263870 RepID=M5TS99_9BACT|nr:hypothetical protein RSSM_06523 [Rhodopirellula sallentina SM41]